MSRDLFAAVATSDVKRVRAAIADLRHTPGLNREIFSRATILDIAIQQANENPESTSSRKIARILRDAGAQRFHELSPEIPLDDEPIALSPRPVAQTKPPLAPIYIGTPRRITAGIASIKRGGATRKSRLKNKTIKSKRNGV